MLEHTLKSVKLGCHHVLVHWNSSQRGQKAVYLLALAGLFFTCASFWLGDRGKEDFDRSKEAIILRKIAHDVLQYTGDSTSRILSPRKIFDDEFVIPFESAFAFVPDSLVSIINQSISGNNFSKSYIVNVIEQGSQQVIFGYAMLAEEQETIVPCKGREQPMRHYTIRINFKPKRALLPITLRWGGLALLVVGALAFVLSRKSRNTRQHAPMTDNIQHQKIANSNIVIGRYLFNPDERKLAFEDEDEVILTEKETRLLSIFSLQLNNVVERERLQKEVWEDEGVLVSRSLDMFVSKLRKRLEKDEHIKLINIHGKGYKLVSHY